MGEGLLPVPSGELLARFVERTAAALDELGLPTETQWAADETAQFEASSSGDLIAGEREVVELSPAAPAVAIGGRSGKHTDDFKELWDVMTVTYRSHPGATW